MPSAPSTFATLLERAVYSDSLGNQLLALSQCLARGIQPGPLATFPKWKALGRYVLKGERAITLCRPVTVKHATTADDGTEETSVATRFVYKPFWFVLAQTDGQPVPEQPIPEWDKTRAF